MISYIFSIITYIFIYTIIMLLFKEQFILGGWIDPNNMINDPVTAWAIVIITAAIPVVRTLVAIMFLISAKYSYTEVQEFVYKNMED